MPLPTRKPVRRPARDRKRPARKPRAPRRAQRVARRPSNALSRLRGVQAVCSITDPFCSHANGGKLFSDSNQRSFAVPLHKRFPLATDASGNGSFLFQPGYDQIGVYGGIAGTTATYTTANVTGLTVAPASYRIVSWGVRITKMSAPLYAAGMLRVRTFATNNGASMGTISLVDYNCDQYADVSLSQANDIVVVGKRTDPSYKLFSVPSNTNPTTAATAWISPGWGAVQIAVTGGPASVDVLDMELIVNYELTLPDSDSLATAATPPKVPNPVVASAADHIYNTTTGIFVHGLVEAASYIEREAAKAIGGYFAESAALTPMLSML